MADRFWLVEDGTIAPFDGDMAEYKAWLVERARKARAENTERNRNANCPASQEASQATAPQKKIDRKELTRALAPLRRKIRDAEAKLAQINREKEKIETKLADPELYQSGNPGEIASLNAHLSALNATQEKTEELWLEAQAELEDASA